MKPTTRLYQQPDATTYSLFHKYGNGAEYRAILRKWTIGEYHESVQRLNRGGWEQVHAAIFPCSLLGDRRGRQRRYLESLLASHTRTEG